MIIFEWFKLWLHGKKIISIFINFKWIKYDLLIRNARFCGLFTFFAFWHQINFIAFPPPSPSVNDIHIFLKYTFTKKGKISPSNCHHLTQTPSPLNDESHYWENIFFWFPSSLFCWLSTVNCVKNFLFLFFYSRSISALLSIKIDCDNLRECCATFIGRVNGQKILDFFLLFYFSYQKLSRIKK